jgi:hypothetical protein
MSTRPTALVIDEGELDLAACLLEDLGVGFARLRGSKVPRPLPYPKRLLLTTAPLAVALGCRRVRGASTEPPFWMAFVRGSIKSQRAVLRQAGFDYLIPERVHPAALRLLLQRALFDGEPTQRVARVALGREMMFSSGLRRHRALLVDISPRGARFLTEGRVVRTAAGPREGGSEHETAVGVTFGSIRDERRAQLKALLRDHLLGPAEYAGARHGDTVPGGEASTHGGEPERAPRVVYECEVAAMLGNETRALVGRDLSEKGLRVEPDPALRPGECVRLAIPGTRREDPLLVDAHVERDDGERGIVLLFDWMDPASLARLRRLMETFPRIHRLKDDTSTFTAVLAGLLPMRSKRS